MRTLLAIGTGKGLFLGRDDGRGSWEVSGPYFAMNSIYATAIDARRSTPRLFAGITSSHFGPSIAVSDDFGASWWEPKQAPVAFPGHTGRALDRIWQIEPGPAEQPDRVYAGSQPSALFVSDDGGVSYQMVESLWDHPHREHWGAGFGGQAIHTVLPHPTDPDSLLVAMSAGGVYRSIDGGATWTASNTGISARFLPDPWPEYGQCVHKVARDAVDPARLYAQNHFGVYRSDNGGESWRSIADGLPSDFGFPIAAHSSRSGVIYNFPLQADGERFAPGKRCAVYRSADAGKSWEALTAGLPTEPYYPSVLRDALCVRVGDPGGVYFGSRSGEVYGSHDDGDSWFPIARHLPDVLTLRAVQV